MKINLKKVLIIILTIGLINFNFINKTYAENKTYSFTVEEAKKYALENNGEILKLKFQNDNMKYTVDAVKSQRRSLLKTIEALEDAGMSVTQNVPSSFDTYLIKQKFTEEKLAKQKDILNKSYEVRKKILELSVENTYYAALMKKITYDDAKRNLDVVELSLKSGAIKLSYGTISEMDYKGLEISKAAAEVNLLQAELDYNESMLDVKEMLGLSFNDTVNLTSKISIKEKTLTLTENKKDELRKNNITFLSAQNDYENANETLKYAKAYYGESSDSYKSAINDHKTADIAYKDAKNNLERTILSTYNNLSVMQKTVKILSDKKDLANLALGIANIRKNYGTATENDVVNASVSYNQALNDYYNTVLTYNLLCNMYEQNITN